MSKKLIKSQKKIAKKKAQLLEVRDTCINCNEQIAFDQRFCSYCGGKRICNRIFFFIVFTRDMILSIT